ncbi:CAP domain-containing protein [Streptomyces sp. NPDC059247]|uniref:CAP domain-containing protein n=1 Tax=Streptomyces sp. NPDC059247 TaxID=3346790 RepID=UPI00369E1CDC
MSAAGYGRSAWAENPDRGPADPASVVADWTDGAVHQENMLDCRHRDTGVARVPTRGGPRSLTRTGTKAGRPGAAGGLRTWRRSSAPTRGRWR